MTEKRNKKRKEDSGGQWGLEVTLVRVSRPDGVRRLAQAFNLILQVDEDEDTKPSAPPHSNEPGKANPIERNVKT